MSTKGVGVQKKAPKLFNVVCERPLANNNGWVGTYRITHRDWNIANWWAGTEN